MGIFSTREIVTIVYLSVLVICIFASPRIRPSVLGVIKAACSKKLVIPFLIMMIYAVLILHTFTYFSFWDWVYLKDVIIWLLFAGVPVCFNAVSRKIEDHYFRNMVIDNVKYAALVEFFTGTFTFNILTEFIIQPILMLFLLLQAVSETKDEYKQIKSLMNWIVPIAGFVILGFTIKNVINSITDSDVISILVSFCIPIVLSLFYLPFACFFAVYAKYETLFTRMKFRDTNDKKLIFKHRIFIISTCMLSYRKIHKFAKIYLNRMYKNMTEAEFNSLIKEFKKEPYKYDM